MGLDSDPYRWRGFDRLEYISTQRLVLACWQLWLVCSWLALAQMVAIDNSDHC
jgi:hypothetical protein